MCGSDATRKTYQVNCAKCATPTESKRKSGKVFCLPCRQLAKNKYQEIYKAKDPEKHKAMRRKRTKQKALVGDKVPCAECGVVIKKKSSRHIRCDACVEAKTLKDRETRKQKRKKVIGTKIKCSDCGTEITKKAPGHKDCDDCKMKKQKQCMQNYKRKNLDKIRKRAREKAKKENTKAGLLVKGRIEACKVCGEGFTANAGQVICCECRSRGRHMREYARRYYNKDDLTSVKLRLRSLIRISIRKIGYKKGTKTQEILGCSWEEFKIHIERQFAKGMSWDNRGDWHLDHIVPISSATTEEECLALNHYTNIRPLWALDNMRKGANMEFLI